MPVAHFSFYIPIQSNAKSRHRYIYGNSKSIPVHAQTVNTYWESVIHYPTNICSNKKRWEWRMQLVIRTHRCCSFILYIFCVTFYVLYSPATITNWAMKRRQSADMANVGILLFRRHKFKWKKKKNNNEEGAAEGDSNTNTDYYGLPHTHSRCVFGTWCSVSFGHSNRHITHTMRVRTGMQREFCDSNQFFSMSMRNILHYTPSFRHRKRWPDKE